MELRTVRRGVAALAIAAILGLAGAHPAAARELGWIEKGLLWISGLWAGDGAAAEPGHAVAIEVMVEKGAGLDPNGGTTPPPTPPDNP